MTRYALKALCVAALVSIGTPAHADAEVETLTCTGRIIEYELLSPGTRDWGGTISCQLGHGGDTGYTVYDTFVASIDGTLRVHDAVSNVSAPEVHYATAELSFNSPSVEYTLAFEDYVVGEWITLTNPDNHVFSGKDQPYVFHIRAGVFGPLTEDYCGLDCYPKDFAFTAEYVYDLPVAVPVPVR